MSFAKTFSDDARVVFLHDEMYALLGRYVYADVADAAEGQVAAQAIHDYYKQEIKQKDEALKDIYARLAQEVDFSQSTDLAIGFIPKIRELEASRQALKTEFVHYRLRHQIRKKDKRESYADDPIQAGLKNYYRFGHEAATSNNDEILIPLQIELTNFWLRLEDGNFWKPFIEGLLLVYDVWLKVATGQSYLDDIPAQEKNLADISNLTIDQKTILQALLETWLGTGLVFAKQPDYERAEQIFTRAIDRTQNLSVDQRLQWFKDVAISLTYRQRAYMRRIHGAFQDAIEDFQMGLHYSRAIDFYHEESTLRNDLGYAQMQKGLFQSAFENMWDGLQLRYKAAIGPRIALSHSSLAQYFISSGAFEEARKHARYAIRISEAVGFRRGLGFGNLAFAEAARRFAFSAQGPSNQAEYLQQAQDAIDIAIHLLDQLSEKARIIDSKLEYACLYRDRVRIETEPSRKKIWFEKSNEQFMEVAAASEAAGIEYRLVDAMCNRVWLGYFAGDLEYVWQAARDFETLEVLKPYWFKDGKFTDEKQAQKNPILLSQIGKYYMARGVMALEAWKIEKKDVSLQDSARYMMLGMTYSTNFASDHRGLREGRRTIYQVLADLNPDELKQFCRYVLQAEEAEKIPQKPSALQDLMNGHALWFSD
jgi:tetratricopeptide (TPR) repeat protein